MELLHTFCKQHGVLAARDTYGDAVAFLNQPVILDSADKSVPDLLAVFFHDTLLDFLIFLHAYLLSNEFLQHRSKAAKKASISSAVVRWLRLMRRVESARLRSLVSA